MEKALPKNWVETEFKNLTSFVIGGDWGKDLEFQFDVDSELVSCIRGSEIKNWNRDKGSTSSIRKVKATSLEKRALVEGDILIEISGGGPDQPVGRTIYVDKEALNVNLGYKKVCTNFLRLIRLYDSLNKKYVKNYLDYFYFSGEILKYQGGSNNLRNLKYREFEKIIIPIPPLKEQQRIVSKLDTLFTHLESLKTRLANIPTLLKHFRQAILTQAVTGKLTSSNFKQENISKAIKFVGGGTPSKSNENYWNGEIPWASVKDFKKNRILKKTQDFITIEGLENSSAKLASKGELLLITRMSPGRTVITDIEVAINQDLKIIRPKIDLSLSFIKYWFQVNIPLIESLSTGTTVKGIRIDVLNTLNIPTPNKEEQTEIVKRVEDLFAKADKIETQYHKLKEKIDSLPQAILAKAFKGELVPQLPTDGDAKELLVEIQKLKEALLPSKKKSKKIINT